MKIAVLDDYQDVARDMGDWSGLQARHEITFFHDIYENLDFTVIHLLSHSVWLCLTHVWALALALARAILTLLARMHSAVKAVLSSFASFWDKVLRPLSLKARRLLFAIWMNPLLPFVASLSTLVVAYNVHSGDIEISQAAMDKLQSASPRTIAAAIASLATWQASMASALLTQFVAFCALLRRQNFINPRAHRFAHRFAFSLVLLEQLFHQLLLRIVEI